MSLIRNPILRGFNPDPSILRVEDDYYIATSTFEWFPGVQIHHSRDLRHWRLLGHPLTRPSQLQMLGNPDSGGIWAPCLSYADGVFYLVYTDVKSHLGPFKDTHNYLVTATDIHGPWSDPVYLNSSGFDPSLFHASDGRKWLLNMVWDHRKGKNPFGGIAMQEYSVRERKLVGPVRNIFRGTELGLTEGPHLYERGGYYYLLTAEGGTRFGHAATVARSRSPFGPYEADPQGPLLTSAGKPELELQRAGHASLVETQGGEWYIAHLCGRPLRPSMQCNLGRETALQRVEWTEDGWLRLAEGGNSPYVTVQAPDLPEHPWEEPGEELFALGKLSMHLASLRRPVGEDWATLRERPGFLRLKGGESLYSAFRQSLLARRQQSFVMEAKTAVEFEPEHYQQMAGLIYYYNNKNYYYLHISRDEDAGRCLRLMTSDRGVYDEPLEAPVSVEGWGRVHLMAKADGEKFAFYYSADGTDWTPIGPVLDAGKISDENAETIIDGYLIDQGFTGAFIGICAQDLSGSGKHADFAYFTYREPERQPV
ncbi:MULTISPECIES: glycoside hydrolase family 43 protein [Cohnella]|uniref:glycoside hydrolase family 43 protein n=1 Tax=Cohnella TaxID=329857 RepID=UPI0009BB98E7|nr:MULTISPECIES: glycoside hydrolase family 43 protein [Cohnella]MBN2983771.1 glycoside hydrolase family 43 protein [Cohnella algarum]